MRHDFLGGCLAIAALVGSAVARPALDPFGSMSMNSLFQRDEDFEPEDLSFIKKIAAVGDSYSAGIGAGSLLLGINEIRCRRYDHSYPYLVNQDERLGDPGGRTFQFESCSGAVVKDIIEKQIPTISNNQDVILISAGGNDAELTRVLNQCIFQWLAFNKAQAVLGFIAELRKLKWAQGWDWIVNSRGCEGQLGVSQTIIESDAFAKRLDKMLADAKSKLADDGMIYYTGYAKFFSINLKTDCHKVTWSTYIFKLYNAFAEPRMLDSETRYAMNSLVELMNEKLAAAVERAGPKVKFVEYDDIVGSFGGRYCEPGVDESSVESNTRPMLMFYELNTKDPWGKNPWKRDIDDHENGTFGGDINVLARAAQYLAPDAEFRHKNLIEAGSAEPSDDLPGGGGVTAAGKVGDITKVFNVLPDGYGRVFHPQVLLHELIANLVVFHITNRRLEQNGYHTLPVFGHEPDSCPIGGGGDDDDDGREGPTTYLSYKGSKPGKAIKAGTKLRILGVGDSITLGRQKIVDGGSSVGNGYRLRLREDLSKDEVVFAGEITGGTMENNNFAAWGGQTIEYMSKNVGPSLKQRPNIILLHAGTNDLDDRPDTGKQGNDPEGIALRLGKLIDQMREACPDAVILVAMIIPNCDSHKKERHKAYVDLIPGVVKKRAALGHHVVAVDFTGFPLSDLYDCLHPTPDGYNKMGDYWFDFLSQIPRSWITKPVGPDPDPSGAGSDKNGGVATDIPGPDYGNPIAVTSKERIREAYEITMKGDQSRCKSRPTWQSAGKIAMGVGKNGPWKFTENWGKAGKVFDGIGRSASNVRFHDMDGDGKADPDTGRLECYLNNLPDGFVKAGSHPKGVIAAGTAAAERVYIADLDADGLEDYLVVDPNDGSVDVWWNKGPSANAPNGWDWAKAGQIAPGALHANLATLRFPDINGDGRADYVFIGKGGSLGHWMNTGTDTGRAVEWVTRHGIATGESYQLSDFSKLVLADINGDGRDDYLVFDADSGLSGFLNQPSNREGVPTWIKQAEKSIAKGINEPHRLIHLADMDGNGKADYIWVDETGGVNLWHNRGSADTSMAIDGLRFADIDGDGVDDYIWVDPETGAPSVRLNMGPDGNDQLGWGWKPLNDGKPIARGTAPGEKIRFADLDGNGRADYIVIDPKDGGMRGWLNGGPSGNEYGWNFAEQGRIFEGGIGPGANVRLADVDGDGFDDYIYLHPGGRTTIYRNKWNKESPMDSWVRMESAEAKKGIQRRPEEIHFHDINGDGKADYLWINPVNGIVKAWINNYPNSPAWIDSGEYAGSVGTAGNNIRFAKLHLTGRASLVAVDRSTNAIAAWLNGCDDLDISEKEHRITITHAKSKFSGKQWSVTERPLEGSTPKDHCDLTGKYSRGTQYSPDDPDDAKYPTLISEIGKLYGHKCVYTGLPDTLGRLRCEGVTGIHCYKDPSFGEKKDCDGWSYTHALYCEW
ncbi:hypothetical protein MRS44_005558 [Fusarium solani]|uniref:uncharacterized protein n=1 Tax=Fusarium solani TaxID=169388 RepID=UPI0032C41C71|nr:hypothetical protein MRS44_005558 [Fusarium solani]